MANLKFVALIVAEISTFIRTDRRVRLNQPTIWICEWWKIKLI